jgi:hypothetical protein
MKRKVLCACALFLTLAFSLSATLSSAQTSPVFKLGFKALADQIPDVVGTPVESEYFNLSNGNSEQHTTKGLMVWRKADNWTAYTNGYMSWINGPNGVESRLNSDRFAWENEPIAAAPPAASPTAVPAPAPTVPPAGGVTAANGSAQCLACHGGSFDKLIASNAVFKTGSGETVNPHVYVPHDKKDTQSIPECTLCHTAHPLVAKPQVDLSKVKADYCFTACHHQYNFTPCTTCH